MMKATIRLTITIAIALLTAACGNTPEHVTRVDELPPIFPDYVDVTVPAGIAPLNFNAIGGDVEQVHVVIKGKKGGQMTASGAWADFDLDEWHKLTEQNRGSLMTLTVCFKKSGQWFQYRDFNIYVSRYALDDYGLTYRRVAPGYEVYGKMGLYQRRLSDFHEEPIMETTLVTGACVNCHTPNRTRPEQFTFHIRGSHGGTLIQKNGSMEVLQGKNKQLGGSLVYPYWHPEGRFCAYSTNNTHQAFHVVRDERIEVFDQSSDVFVYDTEKHEVLTDSLLMTKTHFETYPAFSPDGQYLYYCTAKEEPIPSHYKEIRYDLCRIGFDASTGRYGEKADTIFRAAKNGKSLTFPRPSYDGRFIMFTLSDYGCFPIWHKEADLWLLDIKTGNARPMTEVNSPDTEAFHNWSSGSRWFVFSSRRGNGLYTRLYLACIDDNGQATKPFLLPQRNPWEYYDESVYSFNVPDFTRTKVELDYRRATDMINSDKRTEWHLKQKH